MVIILYVVCLKEKQAIMLDPCFGKSDNIIKGAETRDKKQH